MEKLKVFEGFAGIGAVSKAMKRLNMKYELVGFSEIDKYAIKSFSLIHNIDETFNYGDVCLIDETKLPDFDLYTFGSPCQDFSVAGKQKGATWTCNDCNYEYNPLNVHYSKRDICPDCNKSNINKTRSSLVVEALRIIRHKKPKYLIMENVKGLIGKQFKPSFDKIIAELQEYGYNTYWKVLNAKDYGIPQNRERVFVISIRKDIDNNGFKFPEGFDNGVRLRDLLEDEVDEKYYISQDKTEKLIEQLKEKEFSNTIRSGGRGSLDRHQWDMVCVNNKIQIFDPYDISLPKDQERSTTLRTNYSNGNTQILEVRPCLTPDRVEKRQNGRRFKENDDPSFTLTSQDKHGILEVAMQINHGTVKIKEDDICSCIDAHYGKGLDNHAARTGIMQIGMLDIKGNEQIRRVYDPEGLSPTLNTMTGGNRQPKILESNELKFIGGIDTTDKWIDNNKDFSRNYKEGYRVYDSEGIACCQKTNGGGLGSNTGLYLETSKVMTYNTQDENGKEPPQQDRVYNVDGVMTTISAQLNGRFNILEKPTYRIRKLTPLECMRLMGFDDEDYYILKENGISNSQIYKMAGNSIVCNVLEEIFKELFPEHIINK